MNRLPAPLWYDELFNGSFPDMQEFFRPGKSVIRRRLPSMNLGHMYCDRASEIRQSALICQNK